MTKKILILFLSLTNIAFSQLYQGPANGSVPNGVIVSTNNFDNAGEPQPPFVKNRARLHMPIQVYPDYLNRTPPSAPEGSNFVTDPALTNADSRLSADPLLLKKFLGFNDPGTYIPPDPYIAAGPTHIMAVDNSRFRIWDKSGNLIKNININQWFATALGGADAFDPKVSYDQFNKRWIMVWLDQNDPPNQRGYFLISVSDDSIPIGTWYNWAISSTLNGSSESGTWSDYQGVGFDNQALYIVGRQFGFSFGFFGCKIRIVGKTNLYSNTAGQLTWTDLWEVKDPNNLSITPDVIRPSVIYGASSEYYFMCSSPFGSGTFLILYKLTNPLSSPSMTGVRVPVTAYGTPPLANQLGGSTVLIESGGAAIRCEPVFRNGFIWTTHSVENGNYSSINYVKINAATNTVVEDVTYGANGFWHFYPALSVDQDLNLLLSYSRSGETEYIGAYYTSRLNTDPPGTLSGSRPLQVGKANYVKVGSGRNRWGDYNGSWLDPSDPNNFWIITEYAETPANTWACMIGNLRLVPFSGPRIFTSPDSLNFGVREVNTSSDTLSLAAYNYGSDTLSISNIQIPGTQFQITSTFSFPIRLAYRDSVTVRMLFRPTIAGQLRDTLKLFSNDNTNLIKKVVLSGRGYVINPAAPGIIYGVTGSQENGVFITIDKNTGTGTTVGPTGYTQLLGISIKPSSKQVFATTSVGSNTQLVRVNSALGDAYFHVNVPVSNMRAIAFDLNDDLYGASTDGKLYKINLSSGDTDLVGNTGIANLYGLSINPLNGQLWGISVTTASVYKINKQSGSSVLVGSTGFTVTPDICFDSQGKLYAINGIGTQVCNLLTIDTSTGTGTLVGSIGKRSVNGLAISPQPIGVEIISSEIPDKFELYQNYPNPFNPETRVKFDLPIQSLVKITLYNVTGQEVMILVNQKIDAGRYSVSWNAANYSSGIYFYRIEAGDFIVTRKMVLVK